MASLGEVETKRCPKGHEIPSVPRILQTFSLVESDVLCVYVVGSHLWGTCSRHSDWDLVIIITASSRRVGSAAVNAHKHKLDAWILSVEEYTGFIKDHLMQALITVWLPQCFVMTQKINPTILFEYSQDKLAAAVDKMHRRDMEVARKHFLKSDWRGGLKIVNHCLRQMEVAVGIYHTHCISNYTTVSSEERELRDKGFEYGDISWEEVKSIVQDRMYAILTLLKTQ